MRQLLERKRNEWIKLPAAKWKMVFIPPVEPNWIPCFKPLPNQTKANPTRLNKSLHHIQKAFKYLLCDFLLMHPSSHSRGWMVANDFLTTPSPSCGGGMPLAGPAAGWTNLRLAGHPRPSYIEPPFASRGRPGGRRLGPELHGM